MSNCLRSLAYSTAISIARWATPTDSAASAVAAASCAGRMVSWSPGSGSAGAPSSLTWNSLRVGSMPGVGSIVTPPASAATAQCRSPSFTITKAALAASGTAAQAPVSASPSVPTGPSSRSIASVPRSSPAASGASQRSFCSSLPPAWSARPAVASENNGVGASA